MVAIFFMFAVGERNRLPHTRMFPKASHGHSDTLLDALVKKLQELKAFNLDEIFNVIRLRDEAWN